MSEFRWKDRGNKCRITHIRCCIMQFQKFLQNFHKTWSVTWFTLPCT
ncbi:unnamed protein product [Schistosoma mattheei]|uniref:Uncharacterized protein n=1 Tax=Schistosoma mattheei TaxID=31246 RepID=A0A183NIY2_9TREM|nr:unnamed protein product [Schistosoma mattheei]